MGLYEMVEEAKGYIRRHYKKQPKVAIILGTGLGDLEEDVSEPVILPYDEIPYFVSSTLETHKGRLLLGRISDTECVVMSGRFHLYEGYTAEEVTFGVRVMRALGAEYLLISNVSGGLNPDYHRGDIVVLEDHINLLGVNPLVGPNDERLGPRYPDMCEPYSKELIEKAETVARREGMKLLRGVYAAMLGPSLETRAEYRFLRTIGADCVGMSTVPEVIVGVHSGFKICAFSIITDMCIPDELEPICIEEIIAVANRAQKPLRRLFLGMIKELD